MKKSWPGAPTPKSTPASILKICELCLESPLPCVSGVTGANLTARIEAIMSNRTALRLTLARKALLASVAALAVAAPIAIGILHAPALQAQSPPSSSARFEVASIKPCKDSASGPTGKRGGPGGRFRWTPERLDVECLPVDYLIRDAYLAFPDGKPWAPAAIGNSGTNAPQGTLCPFCGPGLPPVSDRALREPIKGSPSWAGNDRYDIDAKAPAPTSPSMMRGPMMQALLEDRFHLRIHRETKQIPVYELKLAAGGPRFQASRAGSCVFFDRWNLEGKLSKPGDPIPTPASMGCGMFARSPNGVEVNGTTLANICRQLSIWSGFDVLDKTGLSGTFDLHFDARTPEPHRDPAAEPGPPGPPDTEAMFNAIRDALPQLGLKLEPAKGPGVYPGHRPHRKTHRKLGYATIEGRE